MGWGKPQRAIVVLKCPIILALLRKRDGPVVEDKAQNLLRKNARLNHACATLDLLIKRRISFLGAPIEVLLRCGRDRER